MPATIGGFIIDTSGQSLVVDVKTAGNVRPVVYTAANGSSTHTLPVTISTRTQFHVTSPLVLTLSVKLNSVEIAGADGSTITVDVQPGAVTVLTPGVHIPSEQSALAGSGGGGGGTVTSVTAGSSKISIGGTATDPTVDLGTVPESAITNLTTDLAAKATPGTPGLTLGTANAAGVATTAVRTDATLLAFDATAATTSAVADAAAAGTAAVAARRDHVHGRESFATPAVVLGAAAAAGTAATPIRSDSTIVAFDATAPSTQALGDSAVVGTATVAARRDHKHAMPTATAGGDLTGTYPNPTLVAAGPGTTGPIGDATHTPVITIDAKGRVTALTSAAITGGGGTTLNVVTKTANYTAVDGDVVLADATSGAFNVTLPAATVNRQITVKKKDSSANAVTVVGTIDGATNASISVQNASLTMVADGTNWYVI